MHQTNNPDAGSGEGTEPSADSRLTDIIFITLPPDLDRTIGDFTLDPDIPLPVETRGEGDAWDAGELRWEMIIAAILKLLAYSPEHEDLAYYRSLALAAKPDLADELSQAGVSKARNADFEPAEEIFRALSGLLPNNVAPRLNLALLHEQVADASEAASRPDDAEKKREQAFLLYKELLAEDDPPAEVYLNAGYFALKTQSFDTALRHLSHYLQLEPESERSGEIAQLIAEIEKHNLVDNLFKEAYDFIRLGKEDEGIARIREFLVKHPDVWNAWFILGWGLRRLERYEDATGAFQKALELGPRKPDTLNELAICSMETGAFPESEKLLVEALRQEPDNVKFVSNLGILALKREDLEEARAYFLAALEIEPNDVLALQYLQKLEQ
ncbi:MAG: tetratricopeptide repeat protein [Spirochaeta sp.]|nr:tetratricopeptide repeat protein [Spirochaeta sp.]